jgi:probable O-glycosylation ligase (exosortase A-associated)
MLRVAFVLTLLTIGVIISLGGPLQALMLYIWLAYFRPEQWTWTYAFRTIPLSFVVGGYLLLRFLFSSARLRFDFRTAMLVVFLALALVSALRSDYFETSINQFTIIAKSFIISYIIAILTNTVSRLRVIVQTIAFSLAFEGAKQGWVELLLYPGSLNQNSIVFLGDNNGVAVGMLMLVPLFVALGRTTTWKPEKYLYWFLAIGVLYRAISTYSRGGFLAAGVLGLIYILRSPKRFPALVGGVFAACVIYMALPQAYWDRMNTIKGRETAEGGVADFEDSAEGRIFFWRIAARMAAAEPIGVGPGAYPDAYNRYDHTDGVYGRRRAVHSSWFGTLAELGYPGLFLLLWILFLAWRSCRRAQRLARQGKIPPELGHFGAGFEAALITFSIGASFITFQYIEMLWHAVALTMSLNFQMQTALEASAAPATQPTPVTAERLPYIPAFGRAGATK